MKLELDAPNVGKLEKAYLNKAVNEGTLSAFGPYVLEFEKCFAKCLGAKSAVSTQSGTASIHMALHELGIGKGDEVIVPVLTFVATVNPVIYLGATPVFADVDPDTWNIDPEEVEKLVTKKTKAIIPVHLYGNPCNMDALLKIAKKYNIYLIEDACPSVGAMYRGKYAGTFGDFGCFSFNGNKIITTGGGGMLVGSDEKRLGHIKFLINQARDMSVQNCYFHTEIGFNYRMTNLEALLGLAQLERLNEFLDKKKKIYKIYKEGLKGLDSVRFQQGYKNSDPSRWLTCITLEGNKDTDALQKKLRDKKIPTRRIFLPLTGFPPYRRYEKSNFTNAYRLHDRSLCLPSSTVNSEDDIYYACEILKDML